MDYWNCLAISIMLIFSLLTFIVGITGIVKLEGIVPAVFNLFISMGVTSGLIWIITNKP